jgi:hypothetical protein
VTGRVHTSVGVVDGPRESRASVVTTWTPGTTVAQVEETIKAAARQAVADARDRFRAES